MKRFFRALGKNIIIYQYQIVSTIITLTLIFLGIFCFSNAFGRLIESFRDFGLSVVYVFCDIFDIEMDSPTVNNLPDYSFLNVKRWIMGWFNKSYEPSYPSIFIPIDWEEFSARWTRYWEAFANERNVLLYFVYVLDFLYWIIIIAMYAVPIFFAVRALFRKFYFRENPKKEVDENGEVLIEQPTKDSKPLKAWHKFYFNIIDKVVLWLVGLYEYVRSKELLWGGWFLLVLLYFNVFTIAVEFVAYYLYFSIEFDVLSLYKQIYKFCLDLYPFVRFLPLFSWITLIILGLRKKSEDLEFKETYESMLIDDEGGDV